MAPALVADHPDVNLEGVANCPVCSKPMKRYVFSLDSGVVVDRCPPHGIWLDDGELGSLLDYIRRGDEDIQAVTQPLSKKERSFIRQLLDWVTGT